MRSPSLSKLASCGRPGFSLVELLVTMAVAFILTTALLQMMVSSLDSWTRQEKQFSSQREGRAALRLLADDLNSIAAIPEGGPLADEPAAVAGRPLLRFLLQSGTEESVSTTRLAFLRTAKVSQRGPDAGRGDLRLVLYGLALTPDGGASGLEPDAVSQKLVRHELSAAETYRRLESHRLQGQPLVFEADWAALEGAREPSDAESRARGRNAVLAHDVIRFDCRALEQLDPAAVVPAQWPLERLPVWVEVRLRLTNRQTGRLLKSLPDWRGEGVRAAALTNGTPENDLDDAEVRTFTMRLRLPLATQSWMLAAVP